MGEQLMARMGVEAGDRGLLLGREQELDRLRGSLVDSGGGLVVGPAGIGKSHLLAALTLEMEADGTEVIAINGAQSAANVPLAPLLKLVDLGDVEDLGTAVMAELVRRGSKREVLLVVDDAHLLDQDSAALVSQAVVGEFARVLLAARSEKVLAPGLEVLWKDQFVERLDLNPLDRASVELLTEHLLGEVAPPVHAWLWERSHGHPLFVRELIRALSSAEWELLEVDLGAEIDFPDAPESLIDLIGSYLSDLDSGERRALAAVSLTQPVERAVIERVLSPLVVDRLVRRGLVREYRAGLAVSHPLYGEVSVNRLTTDQAKDLRVELAHELAKLEGHEVSVAVLLLDTGSSPRVDLLRSATARAIELRQARLAKRFTKALVNATRTPEALAKSAEAHAMAGEWEMADDLYGEAVATLRDGEDLGDVWLTWIRSTFEYRGDPGRARAIAEQAMEVLEGDDYQVAKAYWLRARMFVEPLEPVFVALTEMRGDEQLHPRAFSTVGVDIATTAWHMCRPHEGLEASVPIEFPERARVDAIRALSARCALAIWGLGYERAMEINRELGHFAERTLDPYAQLQVHITRQVIMGRIGRAESAIAIWHEIQRQAAKTSSRRWMPVVLAEVALSYSVLVGGEEDCLRVLDRIDQLPGGAAYLTSPFTAIARSQLVRREGHLREARDLLEQGVRSARERNAYAHELVCLRELGHYSGATESIVSRASEIAGKAGPGLAQLMADEMTSLAREDAGALFAVSVDAERYGASVVAWEAAAVAQRICQSERNLRMAFECELRVARLAESHPNQISPAVERMESTLTPSQSEVAALAVTGATNVEIGDELFISPRTVKRHLEDIYGRLGISGRDDLAEMYRNARRGEDS